MKFGKVSEYFGRKKAEGEQGVETPEKVRTSLDILSTPGLAEFIEKSDDYDEMNRAEIVGVGLAKGEPAGEDLMRYYDLFMAQRIVGENLEKALFSDAQQSLNQQLDLTVQAGTRIDATTGNEVPVTIAERLQMMKEAIYEQALHNPDAIIGLREQIAHHEELIQKRDALRKKVTEYKKEDPTKAANLQQSLETLRKGRFALGWGDRILSHMDPKFKIAGEYQKAKNIVRRNYSKERPSDFKIFNTLEQRIDDLDKVLDPSELERELNELSEDVRGTRDLLFQYEGNLHEVTEAVGEQFYTAMVERIGKMTTVEQFVSEVSQISRLHEGAQAWVDTGEIELLKMELVKGSQAAFTDLIRTNVPKGVNAIIQAVDSQVRRASGNREAAKNTVDLVRSVLNEIRSHMNAPGEGIAMESLINEYQQKYLDYFS